VGLKMLRQEPRSSPNGDTRPGSGWRSLSRRRRPSSCRRCARARRRVRPGMAERAETRHLGWPPRSQQVTPKPGNSGSARKGSAEGGQNAAIAQAGERGRAVQGTADGGVIAARTGHVVVAQSTLGVLIFAQVGSEVSGHDGPCMTASTMIRRVNCRARRREYGCAPERIGYHHPTRMRFGRGNRRGLSMHSASKPRADAVVQLCAESCRAVDQRGPRATLTGDGNMRSMGPCRGPSSESH